MVTLFKRGMGLKILNPKKISLKVNKFLEGNQEELKLTISSRSDIVNVLYSRQKN